MSGICCIVNFDGAPLQKDLLVKMAAASGYRGPDGTTFWVKGNAGLAYQAFHTTPEAVLEKQPLVSSHDDLVLAMDARLDNREELIRVLTAKNQLPCKHPTDLDLVLAAHKVWEGDCPKQLVGDFAFIIWDMGQRRLFAARDPIGIRQLYYCQNGKTLIISSAVGSILAALEEYPPINTALLQNTLGGNFDRWVNETGYQNIYRLPPSYSLIAEAGSIRLNRYWVLGEKSAPTFKDENEYADCFRELFSQSVQAQLRTINPPAVMGGAGVDSGSIACTADQLIRVGKSSHPIYAYLAVFDQFPEADERQYLHIITDNCTHILPKMINCDDCWALREFPEDQEYPYDDLDIGNTDRAMLLKITRVAQQEGCKVMLTGSWGDQLTAQAAYWSPGFIREIPLNRLIEELPHFIRRTPYPTYQLLSRAFLRPFLPSRIRHLLANLVYQPSSHFPNGSSNAISNSILPAPSNFGASAENIYFKLSGGLTSARLSSLDRLSAYSHVEFRHPYLDRRLVDFILNVPGKLLFRNGIDRYLQREAMLDILPDEIRKRKDKAKSTRLYEIGLREKESQKVNSLTRNSHMVQTGLLDETQLRTTWNQYLDNKHSQHTTMLRMLSIEMWLRKQTIDE